MDLDVDPVDHAALGVHVLEQRFEGEIVHGRHRILIGVRDGRRRVDLGVRALPPPELVADGDVLEGILERGDEGAGVGRMRAVDIKLSRTYRWTSGIDTTSSRRSHRPRPWVAARSNRVGACRRRSYTAVLGKPSLNGVQVPPLLVVRKTPTSVPM